MAAPTQTTENYSRSLKRCWHNAARFLIPSSLTVAALLMIMCSAQLASAKPTHATKSKKHAPKAVEVKSEHPPFSQWPDAAQLIDRLVLEQGFDRAYLVKTFDEAKYIDASIQLIKPAPPGRPKNWKAYRARFVEPKRIDAGVTFWNQYAPELAKAEAQYGVPAEIIVGLIGVETVFGRNKGNFRIMDVLSTLAFDYPDTPTRLARMEFFRKELESFLAITRDGKLDPFAFKGSYAGAIGWPQFMPSSVRAYAVDFDGDGQIDLAASPVDAIGSVANYLAQHGWKKNLPTVFPATLASNDLASNGLKNALGQGLNATYKLSELKAIASTASSDASEVFLYGLIDLQNGEEPTEYWLATDNFFAITQYNRSYFYAMSVIDLGHIIALARSQSSQQ